MRGLSRFLLGSALGAALGMVIVQMRKQKREKASPRAYWEAAGAGAGVELTGEAVPVVPEPEPVAEVEPQIASESASEPPEPAAELEAVAEPEPEPEPEFVTEVAPEPEPEPEPEPVAVPDAGIIGVAAMFEPSIPDLGPAFDVVVSPDLLEEPLPGAGWESSIPPLADEDVEELFPVPPAEEIVDFGKVPAIEAPPLNGGPATTAEGAPSITTADLKARIEETRRRIRRELDEPFLGEGDTTPSPEIQPEPVSRFAAEVPDPEVQDRLERLVEAAEAAAAPAAEPEVAGSEEAGAPSEEAPAPVAEVKVPADARPQPDMELGVDYNAMRARIEETRGRLKAKAFDAMMTGESALLGRESPEKAAERPGPAVLDHDLDQTIETTLREEEDL